MQIPFRSIIVFHAVARAGSISRAAEELRVTPSAVSQQIQALEMHLGTALTVRVGRNISLTEAGERYFEMIGREIEHIADVTQHVRGVRSATTLTVRAAPSVSSKCAISPALLSASTAMAAWRFSRMPSKHSSALRSVITAKNVVEPSCLCY